MRLLQIISPELRVTESLSEDWMLAIVVIVVSLLAFVRYSYTKNFNELFSAVINVRMLREILREEMVLTSRASQILTVIAFLSISLFTYLLIVFHEVHLFGLTIKGLLLYGIILVCYITYYIFFTLSIVGIKVLFQGDFTLTEYEFNVSLFLKVLGLSLFPVSLIIIYGGESANSWFILLGVVIASVSLLWRYGRGLVNALHQGVSIFYIILYLCTFEILPVAVFIKLVV